MRPIPTKLRQAVVHARAERFSYQQIADMFGIGYATVNRILRLHRETRSLAPRPAGGGRISPICGKVADLLVSILGEMPDATVAELTDVLVARSGTTTSRSGVQRALGRLGYSRKKSRSSPSSATPPSTVGAAVRSAHSSR